MEGETNGGWNRRTSQAAEGTRESRNAGFDNFFVATLSPADLENGQFFAS